MESGKVSDRSVQDSCDNHHQVVLKKRDSDTPDKLTPIKRPYPTHVFYNVTQEFCERFSYHGFRVVLVLYLKDALDFSDKSSTIIYHLFITICYFLPMYGAILGDSIWGKYKTILSMAIVYALGEAILTTSSIFWDYGTFSRVLALGGLMMIGIGTGGIKPCVVTFAGDQFLPEETIRRQKFFSIFYAAIMTGSLLSTLTTPLLRGKFHCVNRLDCYPYALGLPCLLMSAGVVVFWLGRKKYYRSPLPDGNVLLNFLDCVFLALKRTILDRGSGKWKSQQVAHPIGQTLQKPPNNGIVDEKTTTDKNHWLYRASDKYDTKIIEDFRLIIRLIVLSLPMAMYWCLNEQLGSLWTLQAVRMNGKLPYIDYSLQPDQMYIVHPLTVLMMIPVYDLAIYPIARRYNLIVTSIQRLTVGGFLTALAFLTLAFVEYRIGVAKPDFSLGSPNINLLVVNGLNECAITNLTMDSPRLIDPSDIPEPFLPQSTLNVKIAKDDSLSDDINGSSYSEHVLQFSLSSQNEHQPEANTTSTNRCPLSSNTTYKLNFRLLATESAKILYIQQSNDKLYYKLLDDFLDLPPAGQVRARVLHEFFGNGSQCLQTYYAFVRESTRNGPRFKLQGVERFGRALISDYLTFGTTSQGELFSLLIIDKESGEVTSVQKGLFLKPETRNLILVRQMDATSFETKLEILQDNDYRLNMLYQLIPYLIIAMSEVMVQITGLEMSYFYAPKNMKSVVYAAWLLTVALGNIYTVIFAALNLFPNQTHNLLFYTALMTLNMIVYAILGRRFEASATSGEESRHSVAE